MTEPRKDSDSLTKGCYYLSISLQYFQDFKRACDREAKNQAHSWVNKLNFVVNDVHCSLTKESREAFRQEITNNPDPIFLEAIAEKIRQLPPEAKETIEIVVDAMLKGETVQMDIVK